MSKRTTKVLALKQKPNQSDELTLAECKTQSSFVNSTVLEIYEKKIENAPFDIQSTLEVLEKAVSRIKLGDLSNVEEMLLNQAIALESIFAKTVERANDSQYMANYQAQMQIALKAQNQCRATLQALVQLKQPTNTQFIRQANISQGHQQVNNLGEKNMTPQNELLKDKYAQLDDRRASTTKGADSTLETLEIIDRR